MILDLLFSGIEWVAAARTEEMEWRGGGEPRSFRHNLRTFLAQPTVGSITCRVGSLAGHAQAQVSGCSLNMCLVLAPPWCVWLPQGDFHPGLVSICLPCLTVPYPTNDSGSEAQVEILFTFFLGHTSSGGSGDKGSKDKPKGPLAPI